VGLIPFLQKLFKSVSNSDCLTGPAKLPVFLFSFLFSQAHHPLNSILGSQRDTRDSPEGETVSIKRSEEHFRYLQKNGVLRLDCPELPATLSVFLSNRFIIKAHYPVGPTPGMSKVFCRTLWTRRMTHHSSLSKGPR